MGKNILFALFSFCLLMRVNNGKNVLQAAIPDHDSVTIKKCHDFKITGDGLSDQWKTTDWITSRIRKVCRIRLQLKFSILREEFISSSTVRTKN